MPDPPSLSDLTDDVQRGLVGLEADLTKSPYKANAVRPLHDSVIELVGMIQKQLSLHPDHPNRSGVRDALSSLRSVEGSMQLLITASDEYLATRNPAERHEIQDTWIARKTRLADQADLCAASLDIVMAFADNLDSPASSGESRGGTTAESNLPNSATTRRRRRPAS